MLLARGVPACAQATAPVAPGGQTVPAPAAGGAGKTDAPVTTLRIGTRLVALSAVVTGRDGAPVKGLTKDDFTLKQDGKEQEIRYFSATSDLPLTVALMVDTSGSQRTFIADETKASELFFPEMLTTPEDRAVLVQFDTNVLQLQRLTHSVAALEAGLLHLPEPHASAMGTGLRNGGTLLYDAIVVTSRAIISKELGRRAMVILTDGGDNGSQTSLEQAIAEAQQADIAVYSVYYSANESFGGFRNDGLEVLKTISEATGGRVYTVSRKTPLEAIYANIAEQLRLQYQLGYRPPEAPAGTFHKLELKGKDKHWTVQARRGYYSPKP